MPVCDSEAGLKDTSTQEHRRVFMALDDIINMIKLAIKDPDVLAVLENLQQKLKGDEQGPSKVKMDRLK